MASALLTLLLIGVITFFILMIAGKKKVCNQQRMVAFYFIVYFMDTLVITLTNRVPGLQIAPNHLWEGFLLWGWSGKTYSIVFILVFLYIIQPLLPFKEMGLTLRQRPGSFIPSSVVIFLIALGSSAIGVLSPKGKFDPGLLLYLAILPGLNEEFVYRGVLPACLNKLFPGKLDLVSAKIGWNAIITTIMFGLLHGFWLDDHFELHVEIIWIRNALFSGIIFAWLRERTGSLITPILAHGAWDVFLFLPRMI